MRLGFFNEQDSPALEGTFTEQVVEQLGALGAGVTMGLRDLTPARAAVVRRLVSRGVPVRAWLLLPLEEGYFATLDNVPAVERRYEELLAWARGEALRFDAIGLDFEPDLRELRALLASPMRSAVAWLLRARRRERSTAARDAYAALVRRIHADGFRVEAYQLPMLLDGRRAGGTRAERLFGCVDVGVDREVVMLYTSLLGRAGPGLLDSWVRECRAVGLGSTGGGLDPLPKLSWPELERDLALASRWCDDVTIFSLEGCVWQGFLPRLVDLQRTSAPGRGDSPELSWTQRTLARSARAALRGVCAVGAR